MCNITQYYYLYCICYKINAALVSIIYSFEKQNVFPTQTFELFCILIKKNYWFNIWKSNQIINQQSVERNSSGLMITLEMYGDRAEQTGDYCGRIQTQSAEEVTRCHFIFRATAHGLKPLLGGQSFTDLLTHSPELISNVLLVSCSKSSVHTESESTAERNITLLMQQDTMKTHLEICQI